MSRAFSTTILISGSVAAALSFSIQSLAEELPTVVVSAARTEQSTVTIPAAIKIITQDDIEASGATNVSEILRNQGGVYLTDLYGAGTHSTVAMRGFNQESAVSNTLIIVDGRRLNNIDIAAPNLGSISIKDIERIEIIQGSAGALYGDQAVGGVINIITRSPAKSYKEIELAAGSYDRQRITAKFEDQLSSKLSYRFTGEYLEADNYRDNNAQENTNVFGRLNYQLDSGTLFFEAQHANEDIELPGALTRAEVEQDRRQSTVIGEFSDTDTDVLRAGVHASLSDNWLTEIEMTFRDQQVDSFIWGSNSSLSNQQKEFTPRLVGVYPVKHGELTATIGADLIDTEYSYESTYSATSDDQRQQAIYAQLVWPFADKWNVTLGARHAKVEDDVVASYKTGKIDESVSVAEYGFSYMPVNGLRIFARVDENFRFAKVDELTYTSASEELRPQTGKSNELGIELKQSDYVLRAVAYRLELKDEIAYDSSAPAPVGGSFPGANVNFDPTTHDGLIMDAYYQLTDKAGLNANFTYTDATFDSGIYEGNFISGVPDRTMLLAGDYRHNENWRYFVELAYTGRLYVQGDNENLLGKQAGYTVMNANINYERKAWLFSARVNNVLNNEYSETSVTYPFSPVYYYPSPERNFWLSAAYRF